MLSIIATVFFNMLKGYAGKQMSSKIQSASDNMKINIFRSIASAFFGCTILLISGSLSTLKMCGAELLICIISGLFMALFQISWLYSVKHGAYMLVSACCSASFIIPFICGIFIMNESPTVAKFIGVTTICIAIYLLCCYNKKINTRLTLVDMFMLFLIIVSQGVTQFAQKIFMQVSLIKNGTAYTTNVFVFAFIFMFLFWLCTSLCGRNNNANSSQDVLKQAFSYIIVVSIALFASNYFQVFAAKTIDVSILYPILNVLSLGGGTCMSVFLFHERMTRESALGILFVAISLLLYCL